MLSTEFLLTSLVVVLIPGTGVIYTVSTGLFLGWKASIAAACGCTVGIIPHLTACILGLSAILHMSARAFQVLKFSGSIYLLYLAWSMWRKTGAFELNNPGKKFGMPQILFKGFLLNILNTKLSIFFLAFLPLFVSPDGNHPVQQMLILSVLFMAMTLIIFMLYGFLASVVSRYFMGSSLLRIRLQRSFASIFAVLAAKLAMSKQ